MSSFVSAKAEKDKELWELAEAITAHMRENDRCLTQAFMPFESGYTEAVYDMLFVGAVEVAPDVRVWRD